MTEVEPTITEDNVRAIAAVALRAVNGDASILDHWEVGTETWLVNFRDGAPTPESVLARQTATVMVAFGGFAVAWYDPWGFPHYRHVKTDEVS